MSTPETPISDILAGIPVTAKIISCDPDKADTAVFCAQYGYALEDSANTILVSAKTGEKRTVACVLLADSRLDVNHVVRKRLKSRRVSFTSAEQTRDLTGMEIGGVTPLALPDDMAVWVDTRVMQRETIILGGGGRDTKIVTTPEIFKYIPNMEVVENLAQVV
ncbi:MAG: YbaK/EbsC family protein [Arenicellales bacterium]|nr:YbaK/EbsC family protein [Arenicellales bacterium]